MIYIVPYLFHPERYYVAHTETKEVPRHVGLVAAQINRKTSIVRSARLVALLFYFLVNDI